MKRVIAAVVLAFAASSVSVAHASYEDCTTSYMSSLSITTCRYYDPWQPSTTTTCWPSGRCITR